MKDVEGLLDQPSETVCNFLKLCVEEPSDNTPAQRDELIEMINTTQSSWTAGVNDKFKDHTNDDVKKYLGAIIDKDIYIRPPVKEVLLAETIPASFDPRVQWPQCSEVIDHTRDQSNCGSCWAHGTTEAFNDRMCIKNGFKTLLSVADTTACCGFLSCFSQGCNGGQIGTPWNWFKSTGVVTGGD